MLVIGIFYPPTKIKYLMYPPKNFSFETSLSCWNSLINGIKFVLHGEPRKPKMPNFFIICKSEAFGLRYNVCKVYTNDKCEET